LALTILAVSAGCAGSMQSAQGVAVTDINQLAGKWAGTVTPAGAGQDAIYVTITPDRKLTAAWGPNTAWGTVSIQNGKATYRMEPLEYEGTMTLYVEGAKKTLVMDDLWLPFYATMTPQQ
jgi:hypothetical protein